jgi:hypothetical protein
LCFAETKLCFAEALQKRACAAAWLAEAPQKEHAPQRRSQKRVKNLQ